jgi:hypothetical protein
VRQNDNNVEKRTFYHIKNLRQPNSSPSAPARKSPTPFGVGLFLFGKGWGKDDAWQ